MSRFEATPNAHSTADALTAIAPAAPLLLLQLAAVLAPIV